MIGLFRKQIKGYYAGLLSYPDSNGLFRQVHAIAKIWILERGTLPSCHARLCAVDMH